MANRHGVHFWECFELTLQADKEYENPFKEVQLSAEFKDPAGVSIVVPGFWDGDKTWKIRFSPTREGEWSYNTYCSAVEDRGLNGKSGTILVSPWSQADLSNNPLRKGFIRVHSSGRYFEHADGTPFYWMGEASWALHTKRAGVNGPFLEYLEDRKKKKFTVIVMTVGHPASTEQEEETSSYYFGGAEVYLNEGGAPYSGKGYERINPLYFKYLDQKIQMINEAGIVPALTGMWGQEFPVMGVAITQEYWRYIVARYAAYNVFWVIAAEYYYYPDLEAWRAVGREIKRVDPYGHPITLHSDAPLSSGRHFQDHDEWFDFSMIQVGHRYTFRSFIASIPMSDYCRKRAKPSIMQGSLYEDHGSADLESEGHLQRFTDRDVRYAAYVSLLQGCIGQTYGGHGIWNFFTEGMSWQSAGDYWPRVGTPKPWKEALQLPGAVQMQHVRAVMESLTWWKLEPHPELVTVGFGIEAYCAAIPGLEYMIYVTGKCRIRVMLPPGIERYEAKWFNPRIGEWLKITEQFIKANHSFDQLWTTPLTPDDNDWVLVLKRIMPHKTALKQLVSGVSKFSGAMVGDADRSVTIE
jgi:hypothetical protein